MCPRNLQDRDSLESRVAAREKTVYRGGRTKTGSRDGAQQLHRTQQGRTHSHQSQTVMEEQVTGKGQAAQAARGPPSGRGFGALREPALALPRNCGSCHVRAGAHTWPRQAGFETL